MDHIAGNAGQLPGCGRRTTGQVLLRHQDAAELRRSHCVRLAPVTIETALEMIEAVPELALLRGFRSLPRGDCDALARAVRAVSLLAGLKSRTVTEAEINPLLVRGEGGGVVAVDALVAWRTAIAPA